MPIQTYREFMQSDQDLLFGDEEITEIGVWKIKFSVEDTGIGIKEED